MDAALAGDQTLHLDSAAREEWVARCEAAYPAVYRALIAIGASESDAADALQDAFEDALKQRTPVVRAEGWLFVVAQRRWRRSR
jgi:DNA-directed RNA polymerase specialized sigma24 family protein